MPKPVKFQVHESLQEAAYQSEEAGNGLGPDLRRAAINIAENRKLDDWAFDCYLGDREDIETGRRSRKGQQ